MRNLIESIADANADHPDSDDSGSNESNLDDFGLERHGYDATVKVEEEHGERVDKAQRHQTVRFQPKEKSDVCDVLGE
jgi:hypothetical protein